MGQSDRDGTHGIKDMFIAAGEWTASHSKIVLPCVLVVCIILTVVVAVNANQRESLEKETQKEAMAVTDGEAESSPEETPLPVYELEEDAHPEINSLIRTYYDAQAAGDIETVTSLNTYLNEIDTIRVQELSKYIDSYPVLKVYTKPGMEENTYVAYVYTELQFTDVDQVFPGMQTYYIEQNDEGEYCIKDGTYDDTVWNYIKQVTLQDDVVDLNNKVTVRYNELLAQNEELNEYVAYVKEKINEDVGEILARAEASEEESAGSADGENGEDVPAPSPEAEDTQEQTACTVRATDVVNIRNSDSEEADKLGKAQAGEEFTLLEKRGNGWSKIAYNGGDAYIKSDYLEVVPEEEADALVAEGGQQETQPEEAPEQAAADAGGEIIGKVTVVESVRVRKGASTDAEALGTAYEGDELDLIMKQADGWTKVKYNGQTAFVKSDYVK